MTLAQLANLVYPKPPGGQRASNIQEYEALKSRIEAQRRREAIEWNQR